MESISQTDGLQSHTQFRPFVSVNRNGVPYGRFLGKLTNGSYDCAVEPGLARCIFERFDAAAMARQLAELAFDQDLCWWRSNAAYIKCQHLFARGKQIAASSNAFERLAGRTLA